MTVHTHGGVEGDSSAVSHLSEPSAEMNATIPFLSLIWGRSILPALFCPALSLKERGQPAN